MTSRRSSGARCSAAGRSREREVELPVLGDELQAVLGCGGGEMEVLTPAADLREVAGVRFGDLRLDVETGVEIQVPV